MYMLGIEYIICSMASKCVSAISALHPSIAAPRAAILGSDIADTHFQAILHTILFIHTIYIYILHYMYNYWMPRKCNVSAM